MNLWHWTFKECLRSKKLKSFPVKTSGGLAVEILYTMSQQIIDLNQEKNN
jgi:hypothetical protein